MSHQGSDSGGSEPHSGARGGRNRGRGSYRGGGPGDHNGGFRGGVPGGFRGGYGARYQGRYRWRGGGPAGSRLSGPGHGRIIPSNQKATTNLRLTDGQLPTQRDSDPQGRQITLRTNLFRMKVKGGILYEYHVKISPSNDLSIRRRTIFQLAESTPEWQQLQLRNSVAHDSSNKLISARKLPHPIVINIPYTQANVGGQATKYYVFTIDFVKEIDMRQLTNYLSGRPDYRDYNILPIVSALNIVLTARPRRVAVGGGMHVGRKHFFARSLAPVSIGGGLEARKGFCPSVRLVHNQLMVNVNACTTAFYQPGNLAAALIEFRRFSFNARPNRFVIGLRVRVTHLGCTITIKQLAGMNARQLKFQYENKQVTVEEYFRENYGMHLNHPDLPLVNTRGQNFLPPEMCEILPDQPFRGRLTEEHTANMITVAEEAPNVKGNAIVNHGLKELGFRQGSAPLAAFGIKIRTKMAVVSGRILSPPGIQYGQGTTTVDERASWNLRNVRFAKGTTLDNWAVLLIQDGNHDEFTGTGDAVLQSTVKGFADMCRKCGMAVGNKPPVFLAASLPRKDGYDPTRSRAIDTVRGVLMGTQPKPSLILVILSDGDKNVYSGIKRLCDSLLGVATVCVHAAKIRREKGQLQYFANVALKVNMKMGGVNHFLDPASISFLLDVPTMLVGISMTHPGSGSVTGTPSIAAIVASVDQQFAHYPASMDIQAPMTEIVANLTNMMKERLDLFKARNGTLPQRILVYRDHTDKGLFPIILAEELPAIKVAFKKFDTPETPYWPRITIVAVCGKSRHTWFYPTEANADSSGNPKPGTVVDSEVTDMYHSDFFLQAHAGLQGTARPTHYYVVHDENSFRASQVQNLTNSLSYMCARTTKAVSVASPAYYADLACKRGRCYLHKLSSGMATSDDENDGFQEARTLWNGRGVSETLRDTMFYL